MGFLANVLANRHWPIIVRFKLFLVLMVGPVVDASAGWSLCQCWRDFWSDEPASASSDSSIEQTPPAVPVGKSKSSHLTLATPQKCERWVAWSRLREMPEYGLGRLPAETNDSGALIVWVHGLNSRPEDLVHLIGQAVVDGHTCVTFRYPNDQAIRDSARLLSRELQALKQHRSNPVYLVTHSMGGLVARAVVENPRLDPGNVERLIMIAPPNHGSNLARYAFSLDIYEYVVSKTRRSESGLIAGGISDGLSQAVRDLDPDSDFLARLNRRPRNVRVRYSIFLGTSGALEGDALLWLESLLGVAANHCRWMACADRQFERHFRSNVEIFAGQGDGLVSIRSGVLPGVRDVVIGSFAHCEILEAHTDAGVARVCDQLLQRLK